MPLNSKYVFPEFTIASTTESAIFPGLITKFEKRKIKIDKIKLCYANDIAVMKRLRLYIDTSVLGGFFDVEEPRRVSTVQRLLQLVKEGFYEGFISLLTIEEVLKAPSKINEELKNKISEESRLKILEETEESIILANAYVKDGAIPEKYRNDARHIATGVFHEVDYIVSWNYKHMVNIAVRRLINSTNLRMGYSSIEIISPEEVTGDGEMEV